MISWWDKMATNQYFNNYGTNTPDQRLIESIIIESIKVYGIDVNYLPRTLVNEDTIFGEDRVSQFKDSRVIEMYIKNVEGFEGQGDFLSKFGLDIRDQITFTVAIRRFDQLESGYPRPREGDLIYFPLGERAGLFEIQFVQYLIS